MVHIVDHGSSDRVAHEEKTRFERHIINFNTTVDVHEGLREAAKKGLFHSKRVLSCYLIISKNQDWKPRIQHPPHLPADISYLAQTLSQLKS